MVDWMSPDPLGWNKSLGLDKQFDGLRASDWWRRDGGADQLARAWGVETAQVDAWLDSMSPEQIDTLFEGLRGSYSPENVTAYLDRTAKAAGMDFIAVGQKRAANEARKADVTAQLQSFVDGLNRPIQNPDGSYADSVAQQLARAGASQAGSAARNQGLTGGITVAAAQQGTQAALLPYLQQRESMKQQGLGMLANRDASLEQMQQGWQSLDLQRTQLEDQRAMNEWAGQQNEAQGTWGAVGAIAGGIVGSAGGPAGAATGAQVGSSALGALGGLGAPASPTYRPLPSRGGFY